MRLLGYPAATSRQSRGQLDPAAAGLARAAALRAPRAVPDRTHTTIVEAGRQPSTTIRCRQQVTYLYCTSQALCAGTFAAVDADPRRKRRGRGWASAPGEPPPERRAVVNLPWFSRQSRRVLDAVPPCGTGAITKAHNPALSGMLRRRRRPDRRHGSFRAHAGPGGQQTPSLASTPANWCRYGIGHLPGVRPWSTNRGHQPRQPEA